MKSYNAWRLLLVGSLFLAGLTSGSYAADELEPQDEALFVPSSRPKSDPADAVSNAPWR